jgi:hypothetical protein
MKKSWQFWISTKLFISKYLLKILPGRWFQIHRKISIPDEYHVFFRILNKKVSRTLANFEPIRKVFNRDPTTNQLIDSSKPFSIKFVRERYKIFSITTKNTVTILKPKWNARSFDLDMRHGIWLRGSLD